MGTIIKLVISIATFAVAALCQQTVTPTDSVSKSTTAIGYQVGGGSTQVDLKATDAIPQASGEAKVEAKSGVTTIESKVKGLTPASKLGTELLTYVLWAVSPDGRTSNLGEIQIKENGEGALKATTQLQTFSLIITAEPYYAVRQPNEAVVLENALRKGTKGKIYPIKEYQLMKRAQYQKMGNPLALTLDVKNVPLEMYEARNAVEIAKSRGAEKYAPEIFTKADGGLKMAENALARKANRKDVISAARSTVQFAEDARALAAQRQEAERIAAEKAAAAAKAKAEAEAKAAAEAAEAKRKSDLEAQRQAELAAAKQAQMKAEADAAAAKAAAKAAAEAGALRAKEEAAKAEAERARQAAEQLRAQLLDSLNRVLETKDTPRGLVVTMADVLFDTGKYDLRGPTRETLARLSGIILANKGLKLEIEGHTDSTGSDELNQKLSEQRAATVRTFLVEQGLAPESVTSKGYGKTMPVSDNATAAGRQANRRVEIIVSGEVIGTKIGR
jgi:outer membrane protein OmpA-like peptidoglycan-associated protein